jgi:hypothetical protein
MGPSRKSQLEGSGRAKVKKRVAVTGGLFGCKALPTALPSDAEGIDCIVFV